MGAGAAWWHHGRVADMRAAHWRQGRPHTVQQSRLLMTFSDELRESSGVAASRRTPGLFWTHNDSGGDPVIYGVHPGHGVVARLVLTGASNRDWEDIDLGPCPPPSTETCLYVGDIGDNLGLRSRVSVLIVEEPAWEEGVLDGDAAGSAAPREVPWRQVDAVYPDGPRDAEALAVTEGGVLYVVSKGAGGSHDVYRLGADALAADELDPHTFETAGALPLAPLFWVGRVVTAGTAVGQDLLVRTYTEVYRYRLGDGGWAQTGPPCFVANLGDGGEGLDWGGDDRIFLTREAGRDEPAALEEARCGSEGGEARGG